MTKPTCVHPRKDGAPCHGMAVVLHPAHGPLCSRHELLVAKQERQEPDRTVAICCRVTIEERERVQRAADLLGLSVSELVRRRLLEIPLPALKPMRAEALLMKEWSSWGRNFNQVAHRLNAFAQDARLEDLRPLLKNAFLSTQAAATLLEDCKCELIRMCGGGVA